MNRLERVVTGIQGLDEILKGGLVAGASYVIQGRPGSGKSIMANQIAFNHVRGGGRVLFATMLSETHERMFQFFSTLDFFDRSCIGDQVQYLSAFDTMEGEGLDEVVRLLRREISRQKASLLVVDGLLNARSRAETPIDTKKFIAELQGHAAFAGCTVIFLTSARLEDGSPEHTMVDGVLDLHEEEIGSRTIRRLALRKTRGSGALPGFHEFTISDVGITVFPRLETLYRDPSAGSTYRIGHRRVPSGMASLDAMIRNGLPESSTTLIMGPSGAGKTSISLNFLAACTPEAPALMFGFYEPPERLLLKASALGVDLASRLDEGALHLHWQPTTEMRLDEVGIKLLAMVREHGIKRLVIDSLGAIARFALPQGRLIEYFSALLNELRTQGVTVLATWELRDVFGADIAAPAPELSSMVDNLILLRFVEAEAEIKRVLSILKVRDSIYDPSLCELVIDDSGIELKKAFKDMVKVLSGSAMPSTQP
ncbi:serine/threonine protein kinase [Pseudomonas oryzihabitans]|uniref:non-specific serine/threonine protein kinase n=1 Tax=Pseudomonas oryzihabitans TaxID=47885 RepID=A0A2Z5AAV7_9PSED|nr:serine/threonine protein kinase [Pseudomonas oryzihabitans]